MAQNATIYKVKIDLSDLRRNYFDTLNLTVALHPSENLERMLSRILSYCLHASPSLDFTRGLSSSDEPEIWSKTLDGRIEHWIELGQPDLTRIKKACKQAERVTIYTYKESSAVWWKKMVDQLSNLNRVNVIAFNPEQIEQLKQVIDRQIELSVLINDNELSIFSKGEEFTVEFECLTKR